MKELLTKIAIAVFYYLAPIQTMMILVGIMIVLDTIVGVWAARHDAIKKGIPIREAVTSKKLRKGFLTKILAYQISLLVLFVLDAYFLNDILKFFFATWPIDYTITKILGVLLIAIECDSIDESVYRVKGVKISGILKERIKGFKTIFMEIKKAKDEFGKSDTGGTTPPTI